MSQPCCDLHRDPSCCDPDDCGPCCPACPTCPVLRDREACPLCGQCDDTYCLHPGPGVDTWTCPACGHDWTVAVSEPVDRRIYRTELARGPAARGR